MGEPSLRDIDADDVPVRMAGGWWRNVIPYAALVAVGVMALVLSPSAGDSPRSSLPPEDSTSAPATASLSPSSTPPTPLPSAATLVATIPIGPNEAIGLGAFDALWLVDERAGLLKRIDPGSAAVTDSFQVRSPRSGGRMPLAASDMFLWVGRGGSPAMVALDPASGRVVAEADGGITPTFMAAGYGEVWATDRRRGLVIGVDAETGVELHRVLVEGAAGLAVGDASVWVASTTSDGLVEIDRSSGQVLRTVLTGPTPTQAYLDPAGFTIYVFGRGGLPITLVDVSGSVRQGNVELLGLTFVDGVPWSLLPRSPVVGHLDPDLLLFTGAMRLPGGLAEGIAFAGGLVWVADATHLHAIRPAR